MSPGARGRLALLLLAVALAACTSDAPPRNVLLISIDSLRADRLGSYGNPRPTSPTIDRLAREGVVFERAYSPTSWTLPSHVTLLTGRDPHQHGTIGWLDTIAPSQRMLQESFRERGYETFGIYSGPFLHPHYGFARGFDSYVSCQSEEFTEDELILKAMKASHGDRTNPAVEAAFAKWVSGREGDRPFFAFVHMWDVHYDYIAPEPYASMFDPGYEGPLDGRDIQGRGFPKNAPRRDVEHLIALYDGEIRYTDDTIGRMLDALAAKGLLDDTLVVVTSDHGEEFLEHGGKTHHRTVYTESVHVPLVLWAARGLPRGLRIATPVALADVAPTIAGVADVGGLAGVEGQSLLPAMRGEAIAARPVLSGVYLPGLPARRTLAIRDPGRTLLAWSGRGEWVGFDPVADPGERRPTPLSAGPDRERLASYDAEVMALLARARAASEDGQGGPPRALVDRLKALGYVK